ncbi:GSCOCT00009989001.2-RA-CDS [Cotesia congregata]|uniref:Carboxylic ester hydrolase n=1 Tax=Cotesia congregata TaxID=51543 RepID=A0A8J2HDU8_COTCN|nr:GSCOCT00009989001.2-RA-CDS [Cotesia congregata]CAG5090922.1 carboxylesterase clade E member 3 [Cotesia congregata]
MLELIFVLCFLGNCFGEDAHLIVETSLGKIRGHYKKTFLGNFYRAFEGVPYAEPPLGALRFRDPEPIRPWSGTLFAGRIEGNCMAYLHEKMAVNGDRVEGTEDCLYLNIYTPENKTMSRMLPVLFYMHGGSFQFGTGNRAESRYIMNRDVVFVSVNYRLGPFGFLSTEDEVVPGNMGLKDQSLAIKWVKNHIEAFGGDPNRITLVGLSAGGASVQYHYLSPMSRGLFHAGISISGTALDCWAQTENSLEKSKKLASILGCPTTNTSSMVECLRTRPGKGISQAVGEFQPWLFNPLTAFGPVIERKSPKAFINRPPVEIIINGDVADLPWMTTLVSEEGLYPGAEFAGDEELMKELDSNWNRIIPYLLEFNFTVPVSEHQEVAQKIREYYLGSRKVDKKSIMSVIHMVGDRLFAVDAEKAARMMAEANKSPVWFSLYSFRKPDSLSDLFIPSKPNLGVSHADDLRLVLNDPRRPEITDGKSLAMQKVLLDIWISFATDGIPKANTRWTTVDPTSKLLNYLHIYGLTDIQMEMQSDFGQKLFWETINFNENLISQFKVL